MSGLLGVVIPAVLGFLASQGALSRTGRLRSIIKANVELLGSLPPDHPSRAMLTAHVEELVETLVRRQRRQFGTITRPGWSFGVYVTLTIIGLAGVAFALAEATGLYVAEPPTQGDKWGVLASYAILTVILGDFAFRALRRPQREHPKSPQPDQA